MKNKIIQLILALLMLSFTATGLSAYARTGVAHEEQVSVLAALEIIDGYPYSYDPDAKVKAKDYFDYLCRLKNVKNADVSTMLTEYGLGADDNVSADIALKSALTAFTYTAVSDNLWKSDAVKLGVLDDTGIAQNSISDLSYDSMCVLFRNILDLPYLEKSMNGIRNSEKSNLEKIHRVYFEQGVVNANENAALDGGDVTGKNEVRIGNVVYNSQYVNMSELLGYRVSFYYHEDGGECFIKWIEPKQTSAVSIYGCDVTEISGNRIRYDKADKSATARLSTNYSTIYNGKLLESKELARSYMRSATAQLTLIDNGSGNGYNVVDIKDYRYYYADAVTGDELKVSDYAAQQSISLKAAAVESLYIKEDGVYTDTSAVTPGKLIAAAQSLDGTVIYAELLSDVVEGEISAKSNDTVTISGRKYYISPAYAGESLEIDKSGSFVLDRPGKIVRCTNTKLSVSQYAYLLNCYYKTHEDGEYYVKLVMADGNITELGMSEKISFNGEKINSKNLGNLLEQGGGIKQLIKYKLNAKGEVREINTANATAVGTDNRLDEFALYFRGAGKYRKNNLCLNSKYMLRADTPIFVLPYTGEDSDFRVINAAKLINNQTYDIAVYDIDEFMFPSCIVMKENFIEPENLRSKRAIVVTEVLTTVNADDEPVLLVEGYQKGSKVTYYAENVNLKDNRGRYRLTDLREGDVILAGFNSDNEINVVQLMLKADADELSIALGSDSPEKYWEGGSAIMPDLYVSLGTIRNRNNELILIDADADSSRISKDPHKFGNNTLVFLYEGGKLTKVDKSELGVGDRVYAHEYQGNLYEVIILRD